MAQIKYSELFQGLKAYILDLIQTAGGGTGPYSPSPHGLFSSHHTGSLADSQAPQFLKTDGSRQLIGNLSVAEGVTVDGVDISGFKNSYDLHVLTPAATAHAGVGVHSHQSNAEGSKLDHGLALIGLLDDDHTQYAHAEGSGTRRAYEAGRLTKSILAGDGLTGGGQLIQNRTLSIDFARNNTWTGTQTFTVAINAQGGINVGTATGATGGNIFGSGVIRMDGLLHSYVMGDLGVGKNNPTERLDIDGNLKMSGVAKVDGTGNSYLMGNVGIGKNNPSEKLDVDGNGRFSGVIKVDGSDHSYIASKLAIGKTSIIPNLALDIEGNTKMSGVLQVDGTGYSYVQGQLGIGTTTSTYTLDVDGTANILTSLRVPIINAPQALTVNPTSEILLQPGNNLVKLMSSASIQADNYASQTTGWRITYSGEADFRYLFCDELHAKSFFADLEQALAGGQIICKSVAVLAQDFTLPAAGSSATFYVKDLPSAPNMAVFQSGDFVGFRQFSRSNGTLTIGWAWGTVSNYADQTDGTQSWTFTRHSSTPGLASGTIYKDALVLDLGISGNGFYEVNAIDGQYAANSPYAQVVTWQTHPATQTVNARFGNLRGIFSVDNEYGLYAGSGTGTSDKLLRLSNTGAEFRNIPINVYDGSNVTINLDPSVPAFRIGASLPTYSTGDGIWMGKDGGTYKLRIGDDGGEQLKWDGSALYLMADANNYIRTNGSNIEFYNAGTRRMEIKSTPEIIIGHSSYDNIFINDGYLKLRNSTTDKIVLDTSGNAYIYSSSTTYLKATGSALEFWSGSTPTKVLEISNTPSVTIGSSSQTNVYIDTSSVQIRKSTTKIVELTSGGILYLNDPGGNNVIKLDASGANEFLNKIQIKGTNSAIAIGSAPPSSSTSGTGIWIDRTGLYGLESNVTQIRIDASNGKIIFGEGSLYIDKLGISANRGSEVLRILGSSGVVQAGILSVTYNTSYAGLDIYAIGETQSVTELAPDWDFTIGGTSYWSYYSPYMTINGGYLWFSFTLPITTLEAYTVNYISISTSGNYRVKSKIIVGYAGGSIEFRYTITIHWYNSSYQQISSSTISRDVDNVSTGYTLTIDEEVTAPSGVAYAKIWLTCYDLDYNEPILNVDYISLKSSSMITKLSLRHDLCRLTLDASGTYRIIHGGYERFYLGYNGIHINTSLTVNSVVWSGHYGNGSYIDALYVGQNNNYDYPVMIIRTRDYGGGNYVDFYGTRWGTRFRFMHSSQYGDRVSLNIDQAYYGVGVGDITPTAKLDVDGSIRMRSGYDGIVLSNGYIGRTVYRNGESYPFIMSFPGNAALLMPKTFVTLRGLWFNAGYSGGTYYHLCDYSGNGRHMTASGYSSFIDKYNPFLRGLALDGTDDYFYCSADGGLQANNWIGVGGWFYIQGTGRRHGFMRCGTSTQAWAVYTEADNVLRAWYFDTTNTARHITATTISTGYHFIAFLFGWNNSSSYIIGLYYDGTWYPIASAPYGMRSPAGGFEFGRAADGGGYLLYGAVMTAFFANSILDCYIDYYNYTKGLFGY